MLRTLFSKQSWLAEIHPLTLGFCEFLPGEGEGEVSDVPLDEKYKYHNFMEVAKCMKILLAIVSNSFFLILNITLKFICWRLHPHYYRVM